MQNHGGAAVAHVAESTFESTLDSLRIHKDGDEMLTDEELIGKYGSRADAFAHGAADRSREKRSRSRIFRQPKAIL